MTSTSKSPVQYLTIDADFAGQRIDNFLITKLKTIPKTHIYRILRKGEVRVNKKRAAPSYRLQEGDQVRVPPLQIEEKVTLSGPPPELKKQLADRILYEDKSLLIINKPAGIAVHGGSHSKWGIIEILKHQNPNMPHLELAHRLDLDTSGCLILVKKRSVLREIHELLREGKVTKIYWTLTKGHWTRSQLRVDLPLRKNILSSGERIVKVNHQDGKEALSIFSPIERYDHASLMKVNLFTGRTHQIRVHAQAQGHPIAGDEKYGDKEFNKLTRELGLKRLFLHAYSIEFTLPSLKQTVKVQAPLEKDLQKCLQAMTTF